MNSGLNKRILTISLPANIVLEDKEAKMILACQLYEKGLITTGQGAEMTGITRREFIENMGKYGASIFQQTIEEIGSDIRNA